MNREKVLEIIENTYNANNPLVNPEELEDMLAMKKLLIHNI